MRFEVAIELAVRQGRASARHRHRAGRAPHLGGDQLVHALVSRILGAGRVPGDDLTLHLRLVEQRQLRHRRVRVGGDAVQHRLPVPGDALRGLALEEVAVEDQAAVYVAFRTLIELDVQVELGVPDLLAHRRFHLMQRPAAVGGDRRRFQDYGRLEQRVHARVAVRIERLRQLPERNQVLQGADHVAADAACQLEK